MKDKLSDLIENIKYFIEDVWDFIKEHWKQVLIVLGVIVVVITATIIIVKMNNNKDNKIIVEPIQELELEDMDPELRNIYLENDKINEDFIATIKFDSGLIEKPVMQAKTIWNEDGTIRRFFSDSGNLVKESNYQTICDGECTGNDVYLWTNWETLEFDKLNTGGSIFMDYRNNLDDENIIIYGHHFSEQYKYDPERKKAFTPLEKLIEKENYEPNKYIQLILEDEIRVYQIAAVFEYDISNGDNYQYYRTNYEYTFDGEYDEGYTQKYFDAIKKKAYYETGVALNKGDKTLTLQTCYSLRSNYREVVVAKEIRRTKYKI